MQAAFAHIGQGIEALYANRVSRSHRRTHMSKSFTSAFGTIAVAMVMVTASAARENATPAVEADPESCR